MKQIVDGKRYDTKTATLLAYAEAKGVGRSSECWWRARLYRTDNLAYFLAGEGGPKTRFRGIVKNGGLTGECIIPMTKLEALRWAETRLDIDEIEKALGDVIQDA